MELEGFPEVLHVRFRIIADSRDLIVDKAEAVGLSSEPSEVVPRRTVALQKIQARGLMWRCGAAPRRGNETKDPTERSSVRTPLRAR